MKFVRRLRRRGHIVMFHTGRVGSTVVGDLVGQNASVYWDGEIYNRYIEEHQSNGGTLEELTGHDEGAILQDCLGQRGGAYYGFEASFAQLNLLGTTLTSFVEGLESDLRNVHFVLLERRNLLRVIVSLRIGRQTGKMHLRPGEKARSARVVLNPSDVSLRPGIVRPLVDLIAHYTQCVTEAQQVLIAERGGLHLTFEDDVAAGPERACRRLCEYVGLPPHDVTVQLRRTNPQPVRDLIENVEEVAAALAGTGFEWMLNEDG
ncbi:MAG: hypothetical protein AAF581_01325 [Planctomycetota bacterium]